MDSSIPLDRSSKWLMVSTKKSANWLNVNNHKHLRITRIIGSLTLLGLTKEAREFFSALQRVYVKHPDKIGSCSHDYWKNAARSGK